MAIDERPNLLARRRIFIEGVAPEIDGGRHPISRVVGDTVVLEVDLVVDGHDELAGVALFRTPGDEGWREAPLSFVVNDRWSASFEVTSLGRWLYTIEAWPDAFATWRRGLRKKLDAGVAIEVDLLVGAGLLGEGAKRATALELARDARSLARAAELVAVAGSPPRSRAERALDDELAAAMRRAPDRTFASRYHELAIVVDRPRARCSAWYEMFPRSCGAAGQHGSFRDAEARLPYIAEMGFDVLYLPPVHPIGSAHRKGKNNSLVCRDHDVGSPWAIGSADGGHTAIHPQLGTLDDFHRFRDAAAAHGIELALDVAFQVSPDHPWVEQHPSWFVQLPDGSIQYAENPPKKYQDIYPISFDTDDWRALWDALAGVFSYWIEQGVTIFRVDNPHTKSLRFWGWCIPELKRKHPEAIFLAEAFTKPKLMYMLAKLGFSQSYTYFTWRESKAELTEYMTELTRPPVSEFFRPNFWPNTPDILPDHLQSGRRGAFVSRLVLASTLSANWGIYGPAFELMDHVPRAGSGEYLDNEKYELKRWDLDSPTSLKPLIGRINRIRRDNPALQSNERLTFHPTDNEQLLCYSKRTLRGDNVVIVAVNLHAERAQSGWVQLDLAALGLRADRPFQVHDLVTDTRYDWRGARNYVALDPKVMSAHIFAAYQPS